MRRLTVGVIGAGAAGTSAAKTLHSSLEYATPHDYDLARTPRALTTTRS